MTKNNSNINYGNSFQKLKNTQMKKATITRVIEPGSMPHFQVRYDGNIVSCHTYVPNAPADDIYNEQANYEKAMKVAKQMEAGATRIEEVLYETPTDQEDDIPENLFKSSQN